MAELFSNLVITFMPSASKELNTPTFISLTLIEPYAFCTVNNCIVDF